MLKKNFAAAAIVALGVAGGTGAMAASVSHTLTLHQDDPGTATIIGSFGIDDSLLVANSQINFADFDFFDIIVAGVTWSLADAVRPNGEGVLTDGAGAVTGFNDTGGTLVEFCQFSCNTFIRFEDGTNNYDSVGGSPSVTSGTYSISVTAAVPLPAALPLLAFGLGGLGVAARRKRKAV